MGEFEPNAMPKFDTHINLISFLLLFLFGGAIVGETVSLSMAVTVAGPAGLGKLFLVNGILLFLLPPLFFNNIDRVNRGKLLSTQLLIVPMVLFCYIAVFSFVGQENMKALAFWILIIYPVSYLSKTTLFLSFWTLANDIYSTEESKKGFPRIAAWGFIGGLCGACGARLLLVVIDAQMILGLWALAYCVAYFIARSVTSRYKTQFLRKEYVEETSSRMSLLSKRCWASSLFVSSRFSIFSSLSRSFFRIICFGRRARHSFPPQIHLPHSSSPITSPIPSSRSRVCISSCPVSSHAWDLPGCSRFCR